MSNTKVEFPRETREEIRMLYLEGVSTNRLAVRYGVSQPVISRVLREMGVEIRKHRRLERFTPQDLRKIRAMRQSGMRIQEIADAFDVTFAVMYRELRHMGVRYERPRKLYRLIDLTQGTEEVGTAKEIAELMGVEPSTVYTLASRGFRSAYLGRCVVERLEVNEDVGV